MSHAMLMIHFTGTAANPQLKLKRSDTVTILFTQYLRPNGLKAPMSVHCRANVEEKAKRIIDSGYLFECEVLTTGEVSLTITNDKDGDVAIKVVPNSPSIPLAVESLINKFLEPQS